MSHQYVVRCCDGCPFLDAPSLSAPVCRHPLAVAQVAPAICDTPVPKACPLRSMPVTIALSDLEEKTMSTEDDPIIRRCADLGEKWDELAEDGALAGEDISLPLPDVLALLGTGDNLTAREWVSLKARVRAKVRRAKEESLAKERGLPWRRHHDSGAPPFGFDIGGDPAQGGRQTITVPTVRSRDLAWSAPILERIALDWLNTMEADGYECTCETEDPCPRCRCEDALCRSGWRC